MGEKTRVSNPYVGRTKSRSDRVITTAVVYFTFVAFGAIISIWGPVWPDLEIVLELNQNQLKYGITTRFVAYACGALCCSFVFQYITRTRLLMMALIVAAISATATPVFPGLTRFLVLQFIFGMAAGVVDTSCNVWILGKLLNPTWLVAN